MVATFVINFAGEAEISLDNFKRSLGILTSGCLKGSVCCTLNLLRCRTFPDVLLVLKFVDNEINYLELYDLFSYVSTASESACFIISTVSGNPR